MATHQGENNFMNYWGGCKLCKEGIWLGASYTHYIISSIKQQYLIGKQIAVLFTMNAYIHIHTGTFNCAIINQQNLWYIH